jgi:hypothetical protein
LNSWLKAQREGNVCPPTECITACPRVEGRSAGSEAGNPAWLSRGLSSIPSPVDVLPIAELELGYIERHVFAADLVERADHTAFEDRPETLNRLSVNSANHVLPFGVVNRAKRVQSKLTSNLVHTVDAPAAATYTVTPDNTGKGAPNQTPPPVQEAQNILTKLGYDVGGYEV